MPFKPGPVQPDFSSLVTSLDNSRTQLSNYSLYQTILFLIQNTARARDLLAADVDTINEVISGILAASYLTENDETALLVNSRRVLAGTGIAFDDSVPGVRTISATSGFGFIPMATGAEPLDFMSNGAGEPLLIGFDTSQPV